MESEELPVPGTELRRADRHGGLLVENRAEARGNDERGARGIVDRDALEVLPLSKPIDQMLKVPVSPAVQKRFDALLETLSENLRAMRQVIAKIAPLRTHLITGEQQRHNRDANDQGQDQF